MAYAEPFCQSNFSFLTGASHAEELIQHADFLRYRALAITDECSIAGVVSSYRHQKTESLVSNKLSAICFGSMVSAKVVLLCPNRQTYAELCRIITNARRRSEKAAISYLDGI